MLNENYIKADKFGITTSDGNVVDLSIDLGEENKDTPFETACRKNTNCKYVCNFHRRKDYSLVANNYSYINTLEVCYENNKQGYSELDKFVYLKDNQWNSLGKLMTKCNLSGTADKINDNLIEYPILSYYEDSIGNKIVKSVIRIEKQILNDYRFKLIFNFYTIEVIT
jgi:hypothetical protein